MSRRDRPEGKARTHVQKENPNRFDPIRFGPTGGAAPERVVHTDRIQSLNVDAAALAAALEREVRGEVRFDAGSRALYATDASNYRQVPIGVVMPRDADDVIATVALARKFGAPILARGGGTSLAGQCCNVAVVLDFTKYMHDIVELNADEKYAWVQPGIVLDDLRNAAEKYTLTYGPDPATHTHCTIGGMIGNNSCGMHAQMAGKVVDNIDELDVLLYDGTRMRVGPASNDEIEAYIEKGGRIGEIYRRLRELRDKYAVQIREKYPKIPRRVSGYNLDSLLPEGGFHLAKALVGTESTCALVLAAKCRLVWSPPCRTMLVLGYDDIFTAADHVPEILEFKPIALEGIDDRLVDDMKIKKIHPGDERLLPNGAGWLLVEFGAATKEEAEAQANKCMQAAKGVKDKKLYDDPREEAIVWAIRESGLGATANVPGRPLTWEGWEDSAVHPTKLGSYLRGLRKLFEDYAYACDLYGHFGQGCVHTRIDFDLETKRGIDKFRAFLDDAADLVVAHGGSLSGEHGDGQSKADMLPKMFGPELIEAFREFKSIWDPDWKMNPGKIVQPYHPTENLRLGTGYRPWSPKTHFKFPEDEGQFHRAVLRCVGVGECRRFDKGVMCPSYMVTREEEHATRGRAHLLFEMFQGEEIPASWHNDSVRSALGLCLACKGCKADCPVNVDMATYKAEFLSHYYARRLRPPHAYAMGWIDRWSRIASLTPRLANLVMSLPPVKMLAQISPNRRMPRYARRTFVDQFRRRPESRISNPESRRVLLWPDTFNNYFHPQTAMAAVEVLEHAGYDVVIPPKHLCCGRPLYDFGFLALAKKRLREIMRTLRPELDRGTPIVGLEPSCVSVFRDELHGLFPTSEDAKRLGSTVWTLSEFLENEKCEIPQLKRKALVQAHCHHHAIMKFDAEEKVMKKMGLEVEHPDSGCCGMAGAFGFVEDNYEISLRVGERVLLPKVRAASPDTLIIADGFSCREQIEQTTNRRALHLAEVLRMAYGTR